MTKYTFPDLDGFKVAYQGRRFKLIELRPDKKIHSTTSESGDYLLWDGLYDGPVGTIKKLSDGTFLGELNSHISITDTYPTLFAAIKGMQVEMDKYSKAVIG